VSKEGALTPAALDGLAMVAASSSDAIVERALNVARDVLGMDIGYLAQFVDGRQVYERVEGDGASFDIHSGDSYPLEASYCRRMTLGRIPHIVADSSQHEETRDLELTHLANIASYIGVPIELSDGTLYGSICCASHDPNHALDERDVQFMQVLARVVGGELENRGLRRQLAEMRQT
jgi:GAF domain-containing protein